MLYAGFIVLTVVLAVILYAGAARVAATAYDATRARQFKIRTALVLAGWLTYVGCTSAAGIFATLSLPPRVPLLLVLPTFVFFIYFFTNKRFKIFIAHTPPTWLVYLQSFRIVVELLLLGMYLHGMLYKAATFEGYNFDILIGLTAPIVGYIAFKGAVKNPLLLVWNISGFITLAIVVCIIISQAYAPQLWGISESIIGKGAFVFPYTYLAGFLMPLAVFMHIFSLVKMKGI